MMTDLCETFMGSIYDASDHSQLSDAAIDHSLL
jgi:hypothetical protein